MKKLLTIFCVLLFLAGLVLLLYPTVSNWLHRNQQRETIEKYLEAVGKLSETDYQLVWAEAQEYNQTLLQKTNPYYFTEEEYEKYLSVLHVFQNGMMGYLKIPKIKLEIPIYHGTDELVLQSAVGHVAGSSLPVGGESTHCVLSGHRGLPSAKLFTELDQLERGDVFMLCILDKVLIYEIDQILVTEPGDFSEIEIVEGRDFCTLMTCTPYGINTHRLLIRGRRI